MPRPRSPFLVGPTTNRQIKRTLKPGTSWRDAHHLLDGNEDKGKPGPPNAFKLSEKEYHATFVLSQYPNRAEDIQNYREHKNIEPIHVGDPCTYYNGGREATGANAFKLSEKEYHGNNRGKA